VRDEFEPFLDGTYMLSLEEASKAYKKGEDLTSVLFSNKVVDEFQVKNEVYKEPMKYETYLDPSLTEAVLKAK
jgi:NitT/TauT family transport system substrate-binding protein